MVGCVRGVGCGQVTFDMFCGVLSPRVVLVACSPAPSQPNPPLALPVCLMWLSAAFLANFPTPCTSRTPLPLWHVLQAFVAGAKLNIPAPLVLKVFALKTFCIFFASFPFFVPPFFFLLSAGRGQHNVACNSGNFVFKHGQLCLFCFALFAGHTTTLSLVSWSWGGSRGKGVAF